MTDPTPYTRRLFLQQGITLASLLPTVPLFIQRSALGMMPAAGMSSIPGVPDDRILVVIQLGGGNDGLNTVVPFGMNDYYNARPSIAIPAPNAGRVGNAGALELDTSRGLGLHPNLTGFKELFDAGQMSVVQGVGYPNPNRSHFTSMDIWHTGRTDASGTGWLGRYFDSTCNGTPIPEGSVTIGRTAPLALVGDIQKPIAFESADLFRWIGSDLHQSLGAEYDHLNRAGTLDGVARNSQLEFLMRTSLDAQLASDRIRAAVAKQPLVSYPGGSLSNQLRIIGAMIRDGMKTRVYYASLGGFDTHGGQPGSHGNLMRQLGDAVRAFQNDLKAQGNEGRVMSMVFSEFGRRVKQNASNGTDHGTAAPVFVIGANAKPGVVGNHPSLSDLDQGDLKFGTDFRSVYAALLTNWMGADSARVLRGEYAPAPVIA